MALDVLSLLPYLDLKSFHTSLREDKQSPVDSIMIDVDLFDFRFANLLLESVLSVVVDVGDT